MFIVLRGGNIGISLERVRYHPNNRAIKGGAFGFLRRGVNFLKRNAGRLLRTGTRLLPQIVDNVVRRNTTMPATHKDLYNRLRRNTHFLPGLINPLIDRIENKYREEGPLDRTDTAIEDLGDKGLKKIEEQINKVFPAVIPDAVIPESSGGKISQDQRSNATMIGKKGTKRNEVRRSGTPMKTPPRDNKGRFIKTSGTTKTKSGTKTSKSKNGVVNDIDSDDFRLLMRGLVSGSGVVRSMT